MHSAHEAVGVRCFSQSNYNGAPPRTLQLTIPICVRSILARSCITFPLADLNNDRRVAPGRLEVRDVLVLLRLAVWMDYVVSAER